MDVQRFFVNGRLRVIVTVEPGEPAMKRMSAAGVFEQWAGAPTGDSIRLSLRLSDQEKAWLKEEFGNVTNGITSLALRGEEWEAPDRGWRRGWGLGPRSTCTVVINKPRAVANIREVGDAVFNGNYKVWLYWLVERGLEEWLLLA